MRIDTEQPEQHTICMCEKNISAIETGRDSELVKDIYFLSG